MTMSNGGNRQSSDPFMHNIEEVDSLLGDGVYNQQPTHRSTITYTLEMNGTSNNAQVRCNTFQFSLF